MDNTDKAILRHIHAAIAMHAMVASLRAIPADLSPELRGGIVDASFAIADAMVERGGPLE